MTFSSLISIQIQWRRSRKKSDHAIWGLSGWLLTSPASTLTTLTSGHLIIIQCAVKRKLYDVSYRLNLMIWLLTSPVSTLTTLTSHHLILQSALKKGHLYESNTFKHSDMVQWHCLCACVRSFVNFSLWWSVTEEQCTVKTDLVSEVSSDYQMRALVSSDYQRETVWWLHDAIRNFE